MKFLERLKALAEVKEAHAAALTDLFKREDSDSFAIAIEIAGKKWDNATNPRIRAAHAEFILACLAEIKHRGWNVCAGTKLRALCDEVEKEVKKGDASAIAPLDPEFEAITPDALLATRPVKDLPNY